MPSEATAVGIGVGGWIIIVLYMATVVILGSIFARGQRQVSDLFLAGRTMGWLAVAISIIASDLSAISYIGAPSWIYREDIRAGFSQLWSPLLWAVGATIFIGLFYKLKLYTVYEFLEQRFHVSIRSASGLLFLIIRGSWLCMALFGASFSLSVVLDIPYVYSVVALGVLATAYTTLGGMKAVIWTDVLQFFVLVGGAIALVVVAVNMFPGGAREVWDLAIEYGKLRTPGWELDPQEKITWWTLACSSTIAITSYLTTDQLILQRAFSTKSRRDAVLSGMWAGIILLPVMVIIYAMGVALSVVYLSDPVRNASLLGLAARGIAEPSDGLVAHFVATQLHPVPAGLIVAGIFAATMSSVDSGINSLTTVCVMDYYRRFFHNPAKTAGHYLRVSRWGTLLWGALGTLGAIGAAKINLETINQKFAEIMFPFRGPMVGVFALGVLTRRANTVGCLTGGALALVTALAMKPYMAFMWYDTVGVVLTVILGYGTSLLWAATKSLQFVRSFLGAIAGATIGIVLVRAAYIHTLPPLVAGPVTVLLVGATTTGFALLWARFRHEVPMEQVTMLTVYRSAEEKEE